MLSFRKINYDQDLEQVIELIEENLDSNFSLKHFLWKHLENPFGRSYGLLALDNEKIVGLRMFMYWKFQESRDKKIITAIRPVDTVVDKDYQGQGLFKRLTLFGLDECKDNYEFIFNTPNDNSLPGYIKMGWEKINHANYFMVGLINPFSKIVQFEEIGANLIKYKEDFQVNGGMRTLKISEYIGWRYKSDLYKIAYFPEKEVYIVYSINNTVYLILYEVLGNIKLLTSEMINSLALKMNKPLIYYYHKEEFENIKFLITKRRKRPIIVLKSHETLESFNGIDFSLADLEAVF